MAAILKLDTTAQLTAQGVYVRMVGRDTLGSFDATQRTESFDTCVDDLHAAADDYRAKAERYMRMAERCEEAARQLSK